MDHAQALAGSHDDLEVDVGPGVFVFLKKDHSSRATESEYGWTVLSPQMDVLSFQGEGQQDLHLKSRDERPARQHTRGSAFVDPHYQTPASGRQPGWLGSVVGAASRMTAGDSTISA